MSPALTAALLVVAAYLVGSIPFGYLIGRYHGVNLFRAGSGNIGATNAGRLLGRKVGAAVFVLDFLKGAVPVAVIEPLAARIHPSSPDVFGVADGLGVCAALATFLGHLFPIFLGLRGGKGVATGAGTVAVLVPGPFLVALATWAIVVLVTRFVSLGSIVAAVALTGTRLLTLSNPFGQDHLAVTAFCVLGTVLIVLKHRTNLQRLVQGTEGRIGDSPMRRSLLRVLHVLAVGIWFGGAGFFNFAAAPTIFRSFADVVATAPNDRTAFVPIVPADESPERRKETEKKLASALAGAAVGPIFPLYFATQTVCGIVAVATAWVWRRADAGKRVHRTRLFVTTLGLLTVLAGWPLSNAVSSLRTLRFDMDPAVAHAAVQSFGTMHLISLGLSLVTVTLAGTALALAAFLPRDES